MENEPDDYQLSKKNRRGKVDAQSEYLAKSRLYSTKELREYARKKVKSQKDLLKKAQKSNLIQK